MAGFLRNSRIELGVLRGKLPSSWVSKTRIRATLDASPCPDAGGWRGNGGMLFSSMTGGTRAEGFGYRSHQRSELAKLGDWACLGLTALAGGLFWTSSSSSTEEMSILERPGQLLFLYGALRYSLQRKVLRIRLKWLRLKLVVREVKLREYEREKEACLVVLEDIMESLEDGFQDQVQSSSEPVPSLSDDSFLDSALALLWRIDRLRGALLRAPQEPVNGFPFMETGAAEAEWLEEQLSGVEILVKRLVGFHAVNEARLMHNKELRAKVDDLLLNLEKER